ncbi:MAG: hypothetical protein JJT78_00875 [Leptospira sp.]|nr:hypothetical protein [Leptospira sp.]
MNKHNSTNWEGIQNSLPHFPNPELSKLFFHSLMSELSLLSEEIGDYTAKDIIFKSLNQVPNISVEWGDRNTYGKNRVLLSHENKIAVLDLTPILQAVKLVWNTFIASRKGNPT